MRGLTPIPTRARRSIWHRVDAELVLQGLATHLEPDRSALPRGRLLAGEVALALPNDERLLLIPWTEPDGSLHGKTLRCLVSGRWRGAMGKGTGERGVETVSRIVDRVPARILLRDVQWTGSGETSADLLISPRDDMTVSMFACLGATLKRTCPIVSADDVIDHLRRSSEPAGWPAWLPNDESAPLRTAPATPPGIDRDVWSVIAAVAVDVFVLAAAS